MIIGLIWNECWYSVVSCNGLCLIVYWLLLSLCMKLLCLSVVSRCRIVFLYSLVWCDNLVSDSWLLVWLNVWRIVNVWLSMVMLLDVFLVVGLDVLLV